MFDVDVTTNDLGPVEKRNVSMWPEQWQIVDELSRRLGIGNVSTTLRFIVTDYARLTDQSDRDRQASAK